jgi:hypothetical protein
MAPAFAAMPLAPCLALPFQRIAGATVHDDPLSEQRFKSPLNRLDVRDFSIKPSDRLGDAGRCHPAPLVSRVGRTARISE